MAPDADFENLGRPSNRVDPVVFDVLGANCEEIAAQITLNDLEVFKRISVSELTSCAWTTNRKFEEAPNIVEFTRRFNSTGHLARREILSGRTPERRAQLISSFIKIAKKLYQLNNLHSTWALISALNTQAIFRLERTWEKVRKHDRHAMSRMAELFSERENFRALRLYMSKTSTPCIPHLGLYLTDLVFMSDMLKKTGSQIDRAGVQENINKLLRSLCSFQDSVYDHLPHRPQIQSFLQSAEVEVGRGAATDTERALYDLSLRCEPPSSSALCLAEVETTDSQTSRRSSLPLNFIRGLPTTPFRPSGGPSTTPRKKSMGGFSPASTLAARWKRGRKTSEAENGRQSMGIENESFAASPVDPRDDSALDADCSPPLSARHTIERWQLTPRRDPESTWYDEPGTATTTDDSSVEERDFGRHGSTASTLVSDLWKKLRISEMADGAARKFRSPRHEKDGSPPATGQFSYSASNTPQNARRFFGTWTSSARRQSNGTTHGQPIETDEEAADKSPNDRRNVAKRALLTENVDADLSGVFTRTQLCGSRSKTKLLRTHQCVFVELCGSVLVEFERRTIPLHAPDERALFHRKPKRIVDLRVSDGKPPRWRVQRPSEDGRPGFELLDTRTGRVFHYSCRSWTVACHWLQTLVECVDEEASDSADLSVRTSRRRLTAAVEAQDRGFVSSRL